MSIIASVEPFTPPPNKTYQKQAPELLLGHAQYDYAVDLWGVGCVLAGLLFKREPFFRGVDDRWVGWFWVRRRRMGDVSTYPHKEHIHIKPSIHHTATSSAASPSCWARRGCWPAATATASRSTARFGACARLWVFLLSIRKRRYQTFLFVWLSLTPTQTNQLKKTQDATPPSNAILQAQEQDPHLQSTTQ